MCGRVPNNGKNEVMNPINYHMQHESPRQEGFEQLFGSLKWDPDGGENFHGHFQNLRVRFKLIDRINGC